MDAIQNTTKTSNNQQVTKSSASTSSSDESGAFDITLKALIKPDGANKVSEEDLFSAIVQERIKSTKGDDALEAFQEHLTTAKSELTKPDGYVPIEDATKLALTRLRDEGTLTSEETDTLYSQSFAAAQLDSNKDALFDGKGGDNDPTVAVATLEQALLASRVTIEKYDSGEEEVEMRSVSEASNTKSGLSFADGTASAGATAGFLFKPVSDSDGKLAVLLPPQYSDMVSALRLVGPDGSVLEEGRYAGNGNGGREHFRFSKPGGSYPDGLTVEATLKSGEKVTYKISDTSQRTEGDAAQAGSSTVPATSEARSETSSDSSDSSGSKNSKGNSSTSQDTAL